LAARDARGNRDPMSNSGTGDSVDYACITIDNSVDDTNVVLNEFMPKPAVGNEWVEISIILSVIVFGSYSLIHAYITHHKNIKPIIIFYIGVSISIYIHFIYNNLHNNFTLFLEIFSGVLIAVSQFYNLKITPKSCNHSHEHSHKKIKGIENL